MDKNEHHRPAIMSDSTVSTATASDDVPSKRQRVDDGYVDVGETIIGSKARKILPVTLLSGFLGAGEYTRRRISSLCVI